MNQDERLNKKIEIAARIAVAFMGGGKELQFQSPSAENIGRFCLDVADAIIDAALGDMTVEPTK